MPAAWRPTSAGQGIAYGRLVGCSDASEGRRVLVDSDFVIEQSLTSVPNKYTLERGR